MAEFKTCFAVPFGCQDRFIGVVLFFSNESVPYCANRMHSVLNQANQIFLKASQSKLATDAALYLFTKGAIPTKHKPAPGRHKLQESTLNALRTLPQSRSEEAVSDIVKVSRRLPFFRYVSNSCREVLCQSMELATARPGEDIISSVAREEHVWYVLIRGAAEVVLRDPTGEQAFVVHSIPEGGAFFHTYIDLYSRPGRPGEARGCVRAADHGAACIRIFVPEECRGQFRGQTKPLMYQVCMIPAHCPLSLPRLLSTFCWLEPGSLLCHGKSR